MLATAWHETAHTMQPIEEYGKGAGHAYGQPAGPYGQRYYGRGYVQLTWEANYAKATARLKQHGYLAPDDDLVRNPAMALLPSIAADIMVCGMEDGWFTGKKLSDFADYLHMRTIINGYDQAAAIAAYAGWFDAALRTIPAGTPQAAPTAPIVAQAPAIAPKPQTLPTPQKQVSAAPIGLLSAILNVITLLFTRKASS